MPALSAGVLHLALGFTLTDYPRTPKLTRWPKPWADQHFMSTRTAKRMRDRGEGPTLTRISARITAVSDEDERKWLESRRLSDGDER